MLQPLIFRGVTIKDRRKTFVKKTTKWKHKHIWAKKNRSLHSIKSWLFDRDPYNGLLQSPHNTRIFSFLVYLRDPKLVKQKQLQRKVSKKETVAVSVNAKDIFFVPFFFGGGFCFFFWGGDTFHLVGAKVTGLGVWLVLVVAIALGWSSSHGASP